MKKFIVLAAVAVMSLSLIGCNSDNPTTDGTEIEETTEATDDGAVEDATEEETEEATEDAAAEEETLEEVTEAQ